MTRKGITIIFSYLNYRREEKRGSSSIVFGIDSDTIDERLEHLKKIYGVIFDIKIYDDEFILI